MSDDRTKDERLARARGLVRLLRDGVVHGSRAVETIEKGYATRTYSILEAVPIVAGPAKVVRLVHDVARASTHGIIRGVTEVAATVADEALVATLGAEEER